MIKNYYYLVAGILAIIFSIALAWNGQTHILPTLNVDKISAETKSNFFYVWHINTAENMLFGVAFIFMSVHKDLSKVRFTAWIIAILMLVRGIVMVGGTLLYRTEGLKTVWVDSIVFILYTGLILLGISVKNRIINK
jgi:hypothetical protein